jgi:hypothetical protein
MGLKGSATATLNFGDEANAMGIFSVGEVLAGEKFKGTGITVIAVAHQYGHRDMPGKTLFLPDNMARVQALGVKVHCGTDLLTATVAALREKYGGGPFGIVADSLRMFCQGAKVAVECAVMACDAGLVSPDEEIISIAGTSKGNSITCKLLRCSAVPFITLDLAEKRRILLNEIPHLIEELTTGLHEAAPSCWSCAWSSATIESEATLIL